MTTPTPAVQSLQIEVDTLCNILDVIASHTPDGPYRRQIEETAVEFRARALVLADRAARESVAWVSA